MNELYPLNEIAWNEWSEWRRVEKKIKIGPIAARKQQQLLCRYPPATQQAMIDHSIANSYQGLFAPKTDTNGTRATSLQQDLSDHSWAK